MEEGHRRLSDPLRHLPSVDSLATSVAARFPALPRSLVVNEARALLARHREARTAPDDAARELSQQLATLLSPTLRRVINATGVILHTNLGRAPLASFEPLSGYANLEYDLTTGRRGSRDAHFAPLLQRLLDAPAIAVNNGAAATFLVLKALAEGGEVIVSRGELIEIGDGFRIPEIMQQSGCVLREVGATNKTRLEDYAAAITPRTRMILRVHPSNFHVSGFTGRPSLRELADLGRQHQLPVYEDLGSGCLVDLAPWGITEPLVAQSLAAGVDLVSFSCDKLLGGPQSGLIAGNASLVQQVRRHPLYRAFRVDKLIVEALSNCLRHLLLQQYDQLPALHMIMTPVAALEARARLFAARFADASVISGESLAGGGSTPDQTLPASLVVFSRPAVTLEKKLRANDPPVIARIQNDQLVLDLRTVFAEEEELLAQALSM
jgi:L-seryl-tRNA(Ser) seleniumtransferase